MNNADVTRKAELRGLLYYIRRGEMKMRLLKEKMASPNSYYYCTTVARKAVDAWELSVVIKKILEETVEAEWEKGEKYIDYGKVTTITSGGEGLGSPKCLCPTDKSICPVHPAT